MCIVWAHTCYSTLVEVRGQFGGAAGSLFSQVASRTRTQVIKLSGKYSCLLGHLSNPLGISFCTWRVLYWYKIDSQDGRMTQQVKVLAIKAEISVSNSWNHRKMEGENPLPRSCPLTFTHRLSHVHPHMPNTHTNKNKSSLKILLPRSGIAGSKCPHIAKSPCKRHMNSPSPW